MVNSPGRYKSIGNGGNRGGRGNSSGRRNQHNQSQNVMFLQKESNGGNSNGFTSDDQIVPGKYGST